MLRILRYKLRLLFWVCLKPSFFVRLMLLDWFVTNTWFKMMLFDFLFQWRRLWRGFWGGDWLDWCLLIDLDLWDNQHIRFNRLYSYFLLILFRLLHFWFETSLFRILELWKILFPFVLACFLLFILLFLFIGRLQLNIGFYFPWRLVGDLRDSKYSGVLLLFDCFLEPFLAHFGDIALHLITVVQQVANVIRPA